MHATTDTLAPDTAQHHTFVLPYTAPLDWDFLLSFLDARKISGIEQIENGTYRRIFSFDGAYGLLEVELGNADTLSVQVVYPNVAALPAIVQRLRSAFDLDADPFAIGRHLETDSRLRALVQKRPGLRVAGAFCPFEQSVRAILGQQISVVAAIRLAQRMTERWGVAVRFSSAPELGFAFPSPAALAAADVASLGMPRSRGNAVSEFARAVLANPGLLLPTGDLERSIAQLKALKGFGDWTAHYIALRALHEPDAFPASDVALLRALPETDGRRLLPKELLAIAERWRPWRAYAAQHLWAHDASCS